MKKTDSQRRRLRLIIMLVLAPIAIFGVIVASKLISVNALASSEQSAYQRRAYAEAAQHAGGLQWWNFVETWKAPYDLGVALGMQGELDGSRALLEQSLEMQGEPGTSDYCVILTNIVLVVEKQGDVTKEGGDTQGANALYYEALDLIDQAPEGCLEEPSAGEADTQQQLDAAHPRIEEKIEEDESGGGDGSDSEEPPPEGEQPQTPQEQLDQQNQDAQQQQQAQEDYYQEQQDGEPGGGSGTDQPW